MALKKNNTELEELLLQCLSNPARDSPCRAGSMAGLWLTLYSQRYRKIQLM